MLIFRYDKTFEGLLTAIFDAYSIKRFPDVLLAAEETSPLFYDEIITVVTDEERSNRVWKGLQKKLSASALTSLTTCWLSELPEIDLVLFRYIHKAIDAPRSIELNFGDPDAGTLQSLEKGKQRTVTGHAIPALSESCRWHLFCRLETVI